MNTWSSFFLYSVLGLLALNTWMYFQQPGMIFFPLPKLEQTPVDWGLEYEDINFSTEDDVQLHGWFIPQHESDKVLLFFHGNAGNISHRRESIEIFHRLGLNVFIFDYRGYGQSHGKSKPSEQGLYRDAAAAWRYLVEEKGIKPSQIILFGRSLGGSVAAHLGADVQARGLILESTMSSAKDFAKQVFAVLSRLVVVRYEFNTADYVKRVKSPVLVLHSPQDEIMPFNLGEKVFASASPPKQFIHMRGDHNSGFYLSQPEYEQQLGHWIDKL